MAQNPITCLSLAQEAEKHCADGDYSKELLEKAIEIGTDDLFLLSAIYSQLGNAYYTKRMYSKALSFHMNDFTISKIMNDLQWSSKSLANLATTSAALHKYDEAKKFAQTVLHLAMELHDKKLEGRAYYLMGNIYYSKVRHAGCSQPINEDSPSKDEIIHDLNQAISYFMRNLNIAEEMNDNKTCSFLYGNLGNAYYFLGDFNKSYEFYRKRLSISQSFGDKVAMRKTYINLGNNLVFLSRFDEAIVMYRRALEIAREGLHKFDEAQIYYYIGQAAVFQQDYITAINNHYRHLKLAHELGDLAGEVRANLNLANDFVALNELPKALYFLILNYHLSVNMDDNSLKTNVSKQIRDVVHLNSSSVVQNGEIIIEPYEPSMKLNFNHDSHRSTSSSSPTLPTSFESQETSPSIEISSELHELIMNAAKNDTDLQNFSIPDCGLIRTSLQPTLDADAIETQSEDMLDMISRVQSKRMDEQRCDPAVLKDSPNKYSIERQSDSKSSQRQHDNPDAIIDLIVALQSRRMDEQRADLVLPGLQQNAREEIIEKIDCEEVELGVHLSRVDCIATIRIASRRGSHESLIDERLYNLILEYQSNRIDDQRSTLGSNTETNLPRKPTIEDIAEIVQKQQIGRINSQRANPPSPSKVPESKN